MYPACGGQPLSFFFGNIYVGQTAVSEWDLCNRIECPDPKPRYTSNEKPHSKTNLQGFCDKATICSMLTQNI